FEAHAALDVFGELGNRDVVTCTDVDVQAVGVVSQKMDARVREIVDIEKFSPRSAAAPDDDLAGACNLSRVKFAQQSRRDVTGLGMKVVPRTVKIGRHCGDEVASMLAAVGLTKLDAGDLGDRIAFVGRLQGARQQRLFGNRLRSFTRIDAG